MTTEDLTAGVPYHRGWQMASERQSGLVRYHRGWWMAIRADWPLAHR